MRAASQRSSSDPRWYGSMQALLPTSQIRAADWRSPLDGCGRQACRAHEVRLQVPKAAAQQARHKQLVVLTVKYFKEAKQVAHT